MSTSAFGVEHGEISKATALPNRRIRGVTDPVPLRPYVPKHAARPPRTPLTDRIMEPKGRVKVADKVRVKAVMHQDRLAHLAELALDQAM